MSPGDGRSNDTDARKAQGQDRPSSASEVEDATPETLSISPRESTDINETRLPVTPFDPNETSAVFETRDPNSETSPPSLTSLQNLADGNLAQGQVIFGKYIVERSLGKGGMGAVWLVRHKELDAYRALKLIIASVAFDPEMRARFRREARTMARFSHPNAVAVHDADARSESVAAYIEMEYVEGQSLNQVLKAGVPMPLDWTARILEQLCDVLQAAHDHGIVHRDLKPGNMMLVADRPEGKEFLKVLDFGIAKILGNDAGAAPEDDGVHTVQGHFMGTPVYASPEQAIGEGIDHRSDIYAVGVILYEFLTGHRPFAAGRRALLDHLSTPPPPFKEKNPEVDVPPEIEQLVLRCLEKDPVHRPQTARDLAEEFNRIVRPPAPKVSPTRRRMLVSLIAAATLLPISMTGWFFLRPGSFTIQGQDVEVPAGETAIVIVDVNRERFRDAIEVKLVSEPPPGVKLLPGPQGPGDVRAFRFAVDLNADPGPKPLRMLGKAGNLEHEVSIQLNVLEPTVYLPPQGYQRAPDSKLVRTANDLNCPDKIRRDLGNGLQVDFLLIDKVNRNDPEPFYIMENKVWVQLFRAFEAEHPEALAPTLSADSRQLNRLGIPDFLAKQGIAAWGLTLLEPQWKVALWVDDWELLGESAEWPVMNVTVEEALQCADWLGGHLPTTLQWEKAAGLLDLERHGLEGPYLKPSETEAFEPGDIAVGRDFPLPVGQARRDISPFGCRDMAGNGEEWTRNTSEGLIAKARPVINPVAIRGRGYTGSNPLTFQELGKSKPFLLPDLRHYDLGFRVTIEILPERTDSAD